MKKGVLIGVGAVLCLIAAAGILYWRSESAETRLIRMHMNSTDTLPVTMLIALDRNENGRIDNMDLAKAKLDAVFSGESLYPALFTADNAKQLGRTAYHADTQTLWCSLSGSGIEFGFRGRECVLSLTGDIAFSAGDGEAARYAVYLNDELIALRQLTEAEATVTMQNTGDEEEYAWVRLIKLSESAHSSLGIRAVAVESSKAVHEKYGDDVFIAAEAKPHLIEFIGDSITCGYGIDGENGRDSFKTANEDAAKAYSYLTAQKLNADYSMVSYSGHGIISGYTTNGKAVTNQLVPKFYGQVGHCPAVIEGRHKIQDDKWGFEPQPDLVVINLGTNDASYTGTDPARQTEFAAGYTEFLKTVREKNPDAPILCTLGIMGQTLCDAIDLAVSDYTKETGDTNIKTMRFAVQQDEDGFAVDWHPSAVTHEKAAEQLSGLIKEWLGW